MKNAARLKAERAYKSALKAWKSFERINADVATEDDEERFMHADEALNIARREMCEMQSRYPTRRECLDDWQSAAFAWQK